MTNIRVVLLCGGRGNSNLIKALDQNRNLDLTLLVNAFDDGLSTGLLRNIVPGMLGPSDFRKNITTSLSMHRYKDSLLLQMFEERINPLTRKVLIKVRDTKSFSPVSKSYKNISSLFSKSNSFIFEKAIETISSFLLEIEEEKYNAEISIGNLIFSGIYLNNKCDFNKSINLYSDLLQINSKILNVSIGENLILNAKRENGKVDICESDIVNTSTENKIVDLALIENPNEAISPVDKYPSNKYDYACYASNEAIEAIRSADLILYGSGTLHSSIFPSLLIINSHIKKNTSALKIMIENLDFDNDIKSFSRQLILKKFLYYMKDDSNSSSLDYLISDYQSAIQGEFKSLYKNIDHLVYDLRSVPNPKAHSGFFLTKVLIDLFNSKHNYECRLLVLVDEEISDFAFEHLCNSITDSVSLLDFSCNVQFSKINTCLGIRSYWSDISNFDMLLTLGDNININLYDVLDGLKYSLKTPTNPINIHFSRNILAKFDRKNLNLIYKHKKSSILGSKFAAFIIRTLILLKFRKTVFDPLSQVNIISIRSLANYLEGGKHDPPIMTLWLYLLKNEEILVYHPIEFFENYSNSLIWKRIQNFFRLIRSIF